MYIDGPQVPILRGNPQVLAAHEFDTITAIATPIGEGGISVIRTSGPQALSIIGRGFKSKTPFEEVPTHTAHFGRFEGPNGELLDEVVVVVYKEPHSYTGENTVEVSCHGGLLVTRRILESIVDYGARPALPGEFTKRAFLNGKLDLSQAEAVADLIQSTSDRAHRVSINQLEGGLSNKIKTLRDEIVSSVGLLELELDFVDQGYEFIDKSKVRGMLEGIVTDLDILKSTFKVGKIYRDGVKVVLAGAPNVGKSSLLNALLNQSRAIVTDIPGTTRDVIEESVNIGGIRFRLVDTAGLRETNDVVELEGVKRTETQISTSDLIVLVLDATQDPCSGERSLAHRLLERSANLGVPCVIALNKIDLAKHIDENKLKQWLTLNGHHVSFISALRGDGLDDLKKALIESVLNFLPKLEQDSLTITNARHYSALAKTQDHLRLALDSLLRGLGGELIVIDLRAALDYLGEITGEITTEDILNQVFSRFCVGK